jgi:alanine racemase
VHKWRVGANLDAGIDCPIHLIGALSPSDAQATAKANLIPSITTVEAARAFAAVALPRAPVHVIIESGMNRVGATADKLESEWLLH